MDANVSTYREIVCAEWNCSQ